MRYVARGCMYCEGECTKECLKEFKEKVIIKYTPTGNTMVRNLMEMYNSMSIEEKNEVIKRLNK